MKRKTEEISAPRSASIEMSLDYDESQMKESNIEARQKQAEIEYDC